MTERRIFTPRLIVWLPDGLRNRDGESGAPRLATLNVIVAVSRRHGLLRKVGRRGVGPIPRGRGGQERAGSVGEPVQEPIDDPPACIRTGPVVPLRGPAIVGVSVEDRLDRFDEILVAVGNMEQMIVELALR